MTLWASFEAAAARHATRTAIDAPSTASGSQRCSYRELQDAALAVSGQLAARNLQAGDRCAILADEGVSWCAAYLAILRLGGVAVPLHASSTREQLTTILTDAQARWLLVDERHQTRGAELIAAMPTVGLVAIEVKADGTIPRPADLDASQPAVILYTAGTTDDPKGVVLTHANLLAECEALNTVLRIGKADRLLAVLPLADAWSHVTNLLLPLWAGASVVYCEAADSRALTRQLSQQQITVFPCTPEQLSRIHQDVLEVAQAGLAGRLRFRWKLRASAALRRLGVKPGRVLFRRAHRLLGGQVRLLATAGSRVDSTIGRDLHAMGFTVLQAYALTETSGAAAVSAPGDEFDGTVGRALPGQAIRILPSAEGNVESEIAISGPIVMQGYFNRPDATREAIRDGWFVSGDLGRLDASGRLTVTARRSEVITVRPRETIDPETIERHYLRSPFISEICVMTTDEDHPGHERLVAAVVPNMALMRARKIANIGDLLRFEIEGQSVGLPPDLRVQDYDICFEPLPRTATGKLKRHEVRRRLLSKRGLTRAHTRSSPLPAPWQEDEHTQAVIRSVERRAGKIVAPGANLEVDLGLDSMARVELIADLECRFGVRLSREQAHEVLTVDQLIEAFRPGAPVEQEPPQNSWDVILQDPLGETDPLVAPLRTSHAVIPFLFYIALRLIRPLVARVEVRGLEHLRGAGPYIITPNHQSYLDPFFLASVLPFHIVKQLFVVGATEYFETALTAWLARQLSLVPVDPDANLVSAMKAAAFGLSRGRILLLFPEGERSIDGTVKRFKKGAPILSRQLGVPMVPVAIRGVFEVWPRNRAFNWRVLLPGSGHRVRISIGPPMQTAKDADALEGANELRDRVAALWHAAARSPER